MSTKTKILLTVVITAIIALLLLIKFQVIGNSATPSEKISATTTSAKPAAPPAKSATVSNQPEVALPAAKPAPTSNPAASAAAAAANSTGATPKDEATAANLRSIMSAYQAYTRTGPNGQVLQAKPDDTAHNVLVILAQKAYLNNAALFFTRGDPLAPNPRPRSVIIGSNDAAIPEINPDFARATLSIVFVANLPPGLSPTTTPVAWTRGLREDGTWAPDSPYGGKGGYIAYMDGHVEWAESLSVAPGGTSFVSFDGNAPTTNVKEALPHGAVILSAEPNGAQR